MGAWLITPSSRPSSGTCSATAQDDEIDAVRDFAARWGYSLAHVSDYAIGLRLTMSGLTLNNNLVTEQHVRRALGTWIASVAHPQ